MFLRAPPGGKGAPSTGPKVPLLDTNPVIRWHTRRQQIRIQRIRPQRMLPLRSDRKSFSLLQISTVGPRFPGLPTQG